uniref:tektin-3-like isoform X3 n=1 Tax=Oncorhynchus gorbuscha TaxID=8017 RepID=UPI001EAF57FE|nr:tektin-3-like isoform X3 [Oncorhynchus gorbuscha]XP_046194719.1 tektin-3-like isoform X3 [Oncorhynchus gorbuscha]
MEVYGSLRPCSSGFLPSLTTMRDSYKGFSATQLQPQQVSFDLTGSGKSKPRLVSVQRKSTEPFETHWGGEQLIRMPPLKPNPVAMCQITREDWLRANNVNFRRLESSRRHAESFWRETSRLIQSKEQLTRRTQSDSSRWIGERITEISFWRSELGFELEQLLRDTERLRQVKFRLDRALKETDGPLQMSQECQFQCQNLNDGVIDVVEKELVQEVSVIRSSQEQLGRTRDKVQKQLDVSVPVSWVQYSEDNIGKSASERRATRELTELVEGTLVAAARDMWSQYNRVNAAFTLRVNQTTHARNTLQQHLAKTLQEMHQTERTISDLEGSIWAMRAPLRVAQSRLEERTYRPNIELCRDQPHTRLLSEVSALQDTVLSLRQRLSEAQATLQQLAGCKSVLEQELYTKAHSLFIDQERCLGLRKTYPSTPRLVGYT